MSSTRLIAGAILLCVASSLITLGVVHSVYHSAPSVAEVVTGTAPPATVTVTPTPAASPAQGPTATPTATPYADVEVTADRSAPDGVSHMDVGVTHTQFSPDPWNNPAAVASAKSLLRASVGYQNQHIYGWGATNPEPSPGVYDWSSLDERVALMRSIGGTMVITLCCAPDWMTSLGTNSSTYPLLAPTPQHYADFADLAARIARRYPDVHYFQVWNEMKGFWDPSVQNFDYVAYTHFYNYVYDALKTVNPHIQVGGPYLILNGSGTQRGNWATEPPIVARNMTAIVYWLHHSHGADFICLDRTAKADRDPLNYSPARVLGFTSLFEDIANQIHAVTNLPIWWSEAHFAGGDWNYQAAGLASILLHALKGGSAAVLVWEPQGAYDAGFGGNYQNLFTDTRVAGGGQPFPFYDAFLAFHQDFGPGTQLYKTTSSTPDVEVVASRTHIVLINKRSSPLVVRVNGMLVDLNRYAVKVVQG